MAVLTHDTELPVVFDIGVPARGLPRRLRDWIARRREIARIEFELNTYSDTNLADLGLTRGDIHDVARGRFRRG